MARCQFCEERERFKHADASDCVKQLQEDRTMSTVPASTGGGPLSLAGIAAALFEGIGVGIGLGILRFGRKGHARRLGCWRKKRAGRIIKHELRYVRRKGARGQ